MHRKVIHNQSDYIMEMLDQSQTPLYKQQSTPFGFIAIKARLENIMKEHKRLLVMKHPYTEPNNLVVISIDKLYDRFALCHAINIKNVKIPYTLNYVDFLDKNSSCDIHVEGEKV